MTIAFSKYSGLGNDFILIDNRTGYFPSDNHTVIHQMCERRRGIGADGVILLETSEKADVKMRIFNADGFEAEMCGNGIRCLMKYLLELGLPKKAYSIEVMESILQGVFDADGLIAIDMGPPSSAERNLKVDGMKIDLINTGVPHAVLFVDGLRSMEIEPIGRNLRHHKRFAPKGANATFAEVLSPGRLLFRTYERGVEGETLACGTGAAAAAFAYIRRGGWTEAVSVENRLGEAMSFQLKDGRVHMTGPALFVYKGQYSFENN